MMERPGYIAGERDPLASNFYALWLCVTLNYSADESFQLMGLGHHTDYEGGAALARRKSTEKTKKKTKTQRIRPPSWASLARRYT